MAKTINPDFKKNNRYEYSVAECLEQMSSDKTILSYLISKAESTLESDGNFIDQVLKSYKPNPNKRIIAVSGAPGVGKSTFINSFAAHLSRQKRKVAILPVDPTSQISRGSILGDKTRMDSLIGLDNVFIKPTSSSLIMGGVAPSSYISIMLCEMADYEYIFLETVGVGQSEYQAHSFADLFLLLLQPAGGDELQGIKRGIMEMANILVINKADGELLPIAKQAEKNYRQAIHYFLASNYGWQSLTQLYSSMHQEYLQSMEEKIELYFCHMEKDDRLKNQRLHQRITYFDSALKDVILAAMKRKEKVRDIINELSAKVSASELHPIAALRKLEQTIK